MRWISSRSIFLKQQSSAKKDYIVSELWADANAHFGEIAEFGMKRPDGSYVGFWGAMSDASRQFLPWEDHFSTGLYLAGVEVYAGTPAPAGWTKWLIPARQYLVAEVTPDLYGQIFEEVIQRIIPQRKMRLAGAVCDFTDPATGANKLLFPVEEG